MMTQTKAIARSMFTRMIVLLIFYALVTLVGAVKFVDNDFLALLFPYHQVGAFSNVLLHLALITGLTGGGIYVVAVDDTGGEFTDMRLLRYTSRLWTVLLILAVLAGLFNLLDSGRTHMELPLLDAARAALIGVFLFITVSNVRTWSAVPLVWTAGMILSLFCSVIGHASSGDFVRDTAVQSIARGLNFNVAYILMAVALGFWLMHRFSNITPSWRDNGLYIVAGLLSIAGVLSSIAPLYTLTDAALINTLGRLSVIVAPLSFMIFASHSYRALSDRNLNRTLSANWYALALVLFLLGQGVLAAVIAIPEVNQWAQGTRLSDLQYSLTALAVIAVCLGVINQASAEMRGLNSRVTGLLPFWLIAFGIIGGLGALAGAGIVQVYAERIFGAGYLDVQRELIPLYQGWIGGYVLVIIGLAIYALGYYLRRPISPNL